ncbi:UNVERIFIED_CONTAM: hypothetical protein GTU68_041426 [Idotea baltica]|nr:hypothetical protein [Idotea baltica]
MPAKKKPIEFETSLEQLKLLVERLESSDLPLDEALTTFEQGVNLTRQCQAALTAAEQKVSQLINDGEKTIEVPFTLGQKNCD